MFLTITIILGIYLILSLVTYLVYAWDKSAAEHQARRVPENTMHLLAMAGGWPGAWLAQQQLRHKTRKVPFRIVFFMSVLLNIAALVWIVRML